MECEKKERPSFLSKAKKKSWRNGEGKHKSEVNPYEIFGIMENKETIVDRYSLLVGGGGVRAIGLR